jgi:hypothetical protein
MARQAEERANPSEIEDIEEEHEDTDDLMAAEDSTPEPQETTEIAFTDVEEEEASYAPTPRRMRFRIEDAA